eukprot:COSAG01_NODE_238_length_20679_cov_140.041399_9_plen_297_part_00
MVLGRQGPKSFFGELAVMGTGKWQIRKRSVRAKTTCHLSVLTKFALDELRYDYPELNAQLFKVASQHATDAGFDVDDEIEDVGRQESQFATENDLNQLHVKMDHIIRLLGGTLSQDSRSSGHDSPGGSAESRRHLTQNVTDIISHAAGSALQSAQPATLATTREVPGDACHVEARHALGDVHMALSGQRAQTPTQRLESQDEGTLLRSLSASPSTSTCGATTKSTPPEALAGTVLHVRRVGVHGWDGTPEGTGTYEDEQTLVSLFSQFGDCVSAVVRHRVATSSQGHINTSWGAQH